LGSVTAAALAVAVRPVLAAVVGPVGARVVHEVGGVGLEQRGALAVHEAAHIRERRGVAAEEPVVAEEPEVARSGDGLGGRLRYVVRLREALSRVEGRQEVRHHALERLVLEVEPVHQRGQGVDVHARHARERIEADEQLVRLLLAQIEDEDRDLLVGRRLGPEVAVDELESFGRLSGQQRIRVTDLRQDAAQRFLLVLGVGAPVLRVRTQLAGGDAAERDDAVADEHKPIL
jgi:hypothetical protein